MDPFTARMLERARDRQRRVDERTGVAPAPARSPLRTGATANSEPSGVRQTEKSASPRRPAGGERREDKENHPNVLHESTRSRLKQLGSLYSADGETDLDAYDMEVTPRQSRAAPEPEPEPPTRSLASSSSSSRGLRSRLAGLASQYQELESEEMQGFTPTGSRSRLVYDFSEPSRSPSPPRVVAAVTKPPSPEKAGQVPYRSASPVRFSPPPRPQPASPAGAPYNAPAREWSPERQGSPTRQPSPMRQGSPTRQPSPVRSRFVQERAAVFDRPSSPPPPNVDPTEMTLSDRRKLFEKGQAPKVIARFGTPVTPHMLRQHAAAGGSEGPPQPARAAAEPSRPRTALEESRSRSPVRQIVPAGPPSPSRAAGASTVQAQRKLWESMNNDWKQNEIAQSSRQQREKELGFLANRWQHKPAELELAAASGRSMEEMAPPAAPAPAAAAAAAAAPPGGVPPAPPPPPPPPPAASPPSRGAGGADGVSPVRHSPSRHSPVRRSPAHRSPSRHVEREIDEQRSSGDSGSSPGSTAYRGSTAADESTVSYASGHSDAESLGAEILAMARANQPPPSLPTIDESSADSSSDLSGMAACAAIDDVLDDMDNDDQEPTPPKRTRKTILRRWTSQPSKCTISALASSTGGANTSASTCTASVTASASTASNPTASTSASNSSATATDSISSAIAATASATAAAPVASSPSVAQLIRCFQCPPVVSRHPHQRRSAPCLRPPTAARSVAVCTSTPRRSMSVVSVPPADVTAVLPPEPDAAEMELGLGTGEDARSSQTLTDAGLADTTSSELELSHDSTNTTPARVDLTVELTDPVRRGADLTFDLADPGPIPSDLGAVSWTGRSPRCWEEEEHVAPVLGNHTDRGRPGGCRLRQYLFGLPSAETAPPPPPPPAAIGPGDLQSGRLRDPPKLGTKDGAPEATLGAAEPAVEAGRGAGEGGPEGTRAGGRSPGQGDISVSDIISQLEAVTLSCGSAGGGGDGRTVSRIPCHPERPLLNLPPTATRSQRQDSGMFRTPLACVQSPEQDSSLPSVVLDGDGAEVPLMHSVSFYRRQRPQEVQVTPVRPVVRNREVAGRYDEPSSSSSSSSSSASQQQMAASTQERIKHLQKEATQQMNVMSQASRALNLCNATIEFTGSAEMVEAERLLLVATHRRQAALSEIQRLKTEGAMWQQGIVRPASRGSLSVSSITLPVKTSFVREVAAGSASYVYHFVVLLRYRGQVIATQMLSSEDSIKGNAINFPNLVSFRELEAEFCVALEVYGLQAQREVLPHDAKYHIRKDRTKTPKKLLKQQSSLTSPAVQSPAGPGAVRATCFQLMGFIHLTARNLTNNAWALEKVPSQSPLDGGVLMTVTCHADCSIEERGFITVFDDVSGFGAWHRRWAALSAGRLAFWRYPEDEGRAPPSVEVDLRRCVTDRVGPVPRDICARQNTLLLVTVRQARPEDADSLVMQRRGSMTRIRHLLSLDGRDERQLWADKLNETLANIRAWDPDAMQPHLDPSA